MIFHLCTRSEWDTALEEGRRVPPSLLREGFLHASHSEQVLATAARFFPGHPSLVAIAFLPDRCEAELRWEPGTDLAEAFPHLYGTLPLAAVVAVFPVDPEGPGVGAPIWESGGE